MKIKDIMSEEVVVIQDTEQVAYARNLMLKNGIGRIVVVDRDGDPIGIVTDRDITHKLSGKGPAWRRRPIDKIAVRRVMNNNLITVAPGLNSKEAVDLMLKNDIGSLPVIDQGELVGIITKTDLMKVYENKFRGKWRISELMSSKVVTVNENHAISHVINIMEENKIGRVVVIRDNEPVGIITSENISFAQIEDPGKGINVERIYFVRPVEGEGKRNVRMISMMTAGDIMTDRVVKLSSADDASEAAKVMMESEISGIPVVDDDELVGIITKTDIIKAIQ